MIDMWRAYLYPLGFISSIAFGLRFLIQWWGSERAKTSIVTPIFWRLSLLANIFLFFHAAIQLHFPICLLQSIQAVISWRNLDLLQTKKEKKSLHFVILLFLFAINASIALFFVQGLFADHQNMSWLSAPYSLGPDTLPKQIPLFIHIIGIIGLSCFSTRFWIQWWQAELQQQSTLPPSFWWISLTGALISSVYFFFLFDWVNLLGALCAIVPYGRNLYLLSKTENHHSSSSSSKSSIFIFAGETSADLYGAALINQLKEKMPHIHFFGVGGPNINTQNVEIIYPMEQFQVMGISDVMKQLPQLLLNMFILKKTILTRNPQLCLFIDQPTFSMRLAKQLRKAGFSGKIAQFVAPTVWAYKKERADIMARDFDLLLTLFSFEPQHFAHTTLKTIWTGHPITEIIPHRPDTKRDLFTLFPGSRPAEIARNLPIQLEAACLFCKETGLQQIAISTASANFDDLIAQIITKTRLKTGYAGNIIPVTFAERYSAMQRSVLALAKSGTVTLELALHEVPTVVTYTLSALNRFVAKNIFKLNLPFYCIVNILKGSEVFPEYIQNQATAQEIAEALLQFQNDASSVENCQKQCQELHHLLQEDKEKAPTAKAAEEIVTLITQ